MGDEHHRHEHDQVAEEDGDHRLPPAHAALDQPGGEHVGGDADREPDPQRGHVVGGPRPLRGARRSEVTVPQARIVRLLAQLVEIAAHPAHRLDGI